MKILLEQNGWRLCWEPGNCWSVRTCPDNRLIMVLPGGHGPGSDVLTALVDRLKMLEAAQEMQVELKGEESPLDSWTVEEAKMHNALTTDPNGSWKEE